MSAQAETELGQAQLPLELGFNFLITYLLSLILSRTGGVFPSTARGNPHLFNGFRGACKAYLVQYCLRHF